MNEPSYSGSVSAKAGAALHDSPWHHESGRLFPWFNIAFVFVFFDPLLELVLGSWDSEYYSYMPFIPLIAAYLIYRQRHVIFSEPALSPVAGLLIMILGTVPLLVGINRQAMLVQNDYLALTVGSAITIWIGGFTLQYGTSSLRAAAFPLLFLFLAVPIPSAFFERIVLFLQNGSAEAAYGLFQMAGVPVAREGFVFHLPTLTIEVAKQCSGIRSSLALLITSLLAGHFFLRTGSARMLLLASIIPIAILKNAFRIFALSVLTVYVDDRVLGSALHGRGGVLFFAFALVLTGAIVALLSRMEKMLPPKGAKCLF